MKVSLNSLKQYTPIDLTPKQLADKLNRQLGIVEETINLAERYTKATIVTIVSRIDHPNADRLHLCRIDDGGVTPDVERGDDGLVQVVCGAPNARAGITVVWLPPGSTVPASFTEKEFFVLGSRELRGTVSHGMLASPKELGLSDSHDGILEIDIEEWSPRQSDIKPGANFGAVYGLDDYILDIENKMFTHRPDCFGLLGVAREIAGIQQQQFVSPQWYASDGPLEAGSGLELRVRNDAPQNVPRLMAVALRDITVKASPLWLQIELIRLGSRPINNIVDVTNYVMLLTGQPLHAYDYDKVASGTITARLARDGEEVALLNGKTLRLTDTDLVITDGQRPVGLAGVMGGSDTEVSAETTNIIIECATFDLYTVRKTSMRHGLFTDAVTRFTKGQSPFQNPHVLKLAIQSVQDVAGGVVASTLSDEGPELAGLMVVDVETKFINARLGLNLTTAEITGLLTNVEIQVAADDDSLQITVPFWRTDLELPEDIVEEVGRLYGLDKLPRELPQRSLRAATTNPLIAVKQALRQSFARAGANELLTYSFVNQKVLEKAGQDSTQAFALSNALSPDLQYYRLSVLPSLLDKVHANIRGGHDSFVIYEIGKGHNAKNHATDDQGLPTEMEFVDAVYASKHPQPGAAFYQIRQLIDAVLGYQGVIPAYTAIAEEMDFPVTAPFDQRRSAIVTDSKDGQFLGMIGELKPSVIKGFKLPAYVAAATMDLDGIMKASQAAAAGYQPLGKFPATSQDICLRVSTDTSYSELRDTVSKYLDSAQSESMHARLKPIDIYQKDDDKKQITFRYTVSDDTKTMTDTEVTAMLDGAAAVAAEAFSAERV